MGKHQSHIDWNALELQLGQSTPTFQNALAVTYWEWRAKQAGSKKIKPCSLSPAEMSFHFEQHVAQ